MQVDVPTERLSIYRRPLDATDQNRLYHNDPQILNRDKGEYIGMVDAKLVPTGGWKRPLWLEMRWCAFRCRAPRAGLTVSLMPGVGG
jgi:hypothetical protein